MKKLFTSLFALMFTMLTYAQIPSSMMYQVMVTTGSTTPQNVKIGMALYTTSDGTTPVWSKDYSFTNVADKTVENLELDFSTVNLSSGAFWLATKINDNEVGRVKLTPVPFACVTKVVEGEPNSLNIIGTWKCKVSEDKSAVITYNANKTFTYEITKDGSTVTTTGTYEVLPNGIIYTIDSSGVGKCDMLVKISDSVITSFGTDGSPLKSFNNKFFTKQ